MTAQELNDKEDIEKVDDLTNEIMDYIRQKFGFISDSDLDDEVYTVIHNIIKQSV